MELLNDVRSAITVIAFTTFLGIVFWAWSGRRKQAFDEAAQLPFTEDEHGLHKDDGGRSAE